MNRRGIDQEDEEFSVGQLQSLQEKLGVFWRDPQLLIQAFRHASFISQDGRDPRRFGPRPPRTYSNERFEFLGDGLITPIVREYLFRIMPDVSEDVLTRAEGKLVSGSALARISQNLGLSEFILLGGTDVERFRERETFREATLAGVFEAVVAALYFDQGHEAVVSFIQRVLLDRPEARSVQDSVDPKASLAKLVRAGVDYRLIQKKGSPHAPIYVVGAYAGSKFLGQGSAEKRHRAEIRAAEDALHNLEPR